MQMILSGVELSAKELSLARAMFAAIHGHDAQPGELEKEIWSHYEAAYVRERLRQDGRTEEYTYSCISVWRKLIEHEPELGTILREDLLDRSRKQDDIPSNKLPYWGMPTETHGVGVVDTKHPITFDDVTTGLPLSPHVPQWGTQLIIELNENGFTTTLKRDASLRNWSVPKLSKFWGLRKPKVALILAYSSKKEEESS